ncbi:methionine aminopeptidase, type II [Plasmodium vivax India VII]|uniref:Methionine aminopeptidase 2 n=5 Tax=Plasmodium vivax TaxID=5855 RepID=A5K0Q4_PLAVS|nr:methionine aminopeptidase, type II, putative [Plasmodium vivax]KMZ78503.1 methionine aminopeptidase, type II [Plasmodium vivax India VII]KMZ83689.1 methionine aminopeptidase, type II [Plasmodium vivax Brazil I]KMZ90888.1 methionine aminopeptidase, type II [Plasmodium vivax Mauritania I]EDL46901.1 methionine aminopeptidase, type II, putative [Plasmodium vivax]CAI7722803.1 methionine aminopeptidase 2, putative [Plasmodium vivax]|eukprot:XP_001616628.1 methionine aminopeptidase, type II [Plasmodium vivax Sal-1]
MNRGNRGGAKGSTTGAKKKPTQSNEKGKGAKGVGAPTPGSKTTAQQKSEKRECADVQAVSAEAANNKVAANEAATNKETTNKAAPNKTPNKAANKPNKAPAKKSKKKVDKLDLILSEFKSEVNQGGAAPNGHNAAEGEATAVEKAEEEHKIDFDEFEIEKIKKSITLKEHLMEEQNNSHIRLLNNWPQVERSIQTSPATVPIEMVYQGKNYPVGEIQNYKHVLSGKTLQEKKEAEKLSSAYYEDLRKAAECHRQVRKYIQTYVQPGRKMIDIVKETEKKTKELILSHKLNCGWGFPTGCSLNNCAAHYTPNYGDETVLKYDDVCKLDFGVHVNGYIIDCAFTIAFNEKYDNLIKATQDGTNTGIREAGIDARMCDIGEAIQEAIESYELELNQKTYPIKAISNLRGHSINKYIIHGGKCVPIVKQKEKNEIMEEGELFAIETFASTGKGYVTHDNECSHYMRNPEKQFVPIRLNSAKTLLKVINDNFDTLPFCHRWLDDLGQKRHFMALKTLVDLNIVEPYPPLCDVRNSFTSQMEHTILLRPTCKEVLSRGPDF